MRIDLYTKTILSLIALLLTVIAFKTLVEPMPTSASASDVVVICSACTYDGLPRENHTILMDRSTGDIWAYRKFLGTEAPVNLGRLTLGKPLEKSK